MGGSDQVRNPYRWIYEAASDNGWNYTGYNISVDDDCNIDSNIQVPAILGSMQRDDTVPISCILSNHPCRAAVWVAAVSAAAELMIEKQKWLSRVTTQSHTYDCLRQST